jgi:uncharacterized protein YbaR (Trm112 family)
MAAEMFACPECQASLRYSPNLRPGDEVQCPKCRAQFPVPDPAMLPPDPATRPTEEYTDTPGSPRPRFSQPADDEISPTRRPAGYGAARNDYPDEDYDDRPFTGAYSIDINSWFVFAGKHYSAILGPAIGFIFVAAIISIIPILVVAGGAQFVGFQVAQHDPGMMFLITQVLAQLGQLFIMSVVVFPLGSGFTAVCLAQLKGRPWTFGDFFSGFQHFGALAGVGLASQLLGLVVTLPQMIITFFAMQNQDFQLLPVGVGCTLVGLLFAVYFQVRIFLFAPTIIFDRNLGAMDAMKANWELTRGHFWGLFGVGLILFLIYLGGALACGIGVLFALPYIILILNAGYLLITGARGPDEFAARYND